MIDPQKNSPEQLLALLQAAIRDAPVFEYEKPLSEVELRWLGRSDALLEASGGLSALISFRTARDALGSYRHSRDKILLPLYDALSRTELLVPESLQGAFIPAGDTWNGYAAIIKIVQRECNTLLIVDPYLNSDFYIHFAPHCAASMNTRCLTVQQPQYHASLLASVQKWQADTTSKPHPVELRFAPKGELHDRLIIIDGKEVWLISQSIKDIAKNSPASVTRAEEELSQMKAQHYEEIWQKSTQLA